MTSFLRNQLSEILLEDNGAFFPPETDCSFSKNIFAINLRKIALKYESWLHKDSYMDIKEFSLIIEVGKTPGLLMMKMKIPDYSMTIENGDELLFFSQEIATKFPEVLLDIDEMRKNVLKTVVQYNSNSSIFSKILETIDLLLIISVSFYLASIRSIFYYKPSKDSEKYGIFVRMMRELWEKHKKELTFFEKWKKIKQICSNKINFDF